MPIVAADVVAAMAKRTELKRMLSCNDWQSLIEEKCRSLNV
jgi:hypothetical protein